MAQFDIGWRNVNQDIDPAFTRPQSYGGAIGTIGQALSTYADAKRAENTNSILMQLAQAKTQSDIAGSQASILDNIAAKQGAVDGLGLLDALNAKRDDVTKRVALEQTQLGQRAVNESILKGATYEDFQSGVQTAMNDGSEEPSAEYLAVASNYIQDAKAKAAAASQQAFQNKLDSIKTANEIEKTNINGKELTLKLAQLGVENPGGDVVSYETDPATGEIRKVVTHKPGALEIFGGLNGNSGGNPSTRTALNEVKTKESGGDYNTLYGHSQKAGGKFAGVNVTDMTINEALEFTKAGGEYAEWSKTQKGVKPGTYATPIGAYQIVGSTLKTAAKAMGLSGNEKLTPEMQDKLAEYVLQTQGSKAFLAYKGPEIKPTGYTGSKGTGALNNAVNNGDGTTTVNTGGKSSGKLPITLNSALANAIPRIMPEYRAKVKEDANARLASLDPVWIRQDFNNFLAENGAVEGKSAVGQSNNYTIYQAVENAKIPGYTGLSAEDKKQVLTSLFKWGEKNPGIGMLGIHANTNAALIKKQIPLAVQQVVAVKLQAEKAKEIAYVRQQADTVYKAIKKDNPHATLDDALQLVSREHYSKLKNPPKSTKVSKPASTRIPATLKRPNINEDARFNLTNNPFQ